MKDAWSQLIPTRAEYCARVCTKDGNLALAGSGDLRRRSLIDVGGQFAHQPHRRLFVIVGPADGVAELGHGHHQGISDQREGPRAAILIAQ